MGRGRTRSPLREEASDGPARGASRPEPGARGPGTADTAEHHRAPGGPRPTEPGTAAGASGRRGCPQRSAPPAPEAPRLAAPPGLGPPGPHAPAGFVCQGLDLTAAPVSPSLCFDLLVQRVAATLRRSEPGGRHAPRARAREVGASGAGSPESTEAARDGVADPASLVFTGYGKTTLIFSYFRNYIVGYFAVFVTRTCPQGSGCAAWTALPVSVALASRGARRARGPAPEGRRTGALLDSEAEVKPPSSLDGLSRKPTVGGR